jgi:hypothetical protein
VRSKTRGYLQPIFFTQTACPKSQDRLGSRAANSAQRIFSFLFVAEQWWMAKKALRTKLRVCWTAVFSVIQANFK